MGLMLGIIVLYSSTGSFGWDATLTAPVATLVCALIFMGVMGKSAQVPLHIWLPDAMEGPTPVSALLHAATMVAAGVFLVVRAYPLFEQAPMVLDAMLWIGSITALTAAIIALTQDDIKKVLAYSTCSQLGYMVAALGAGSMVAGFFHLTTHAFFKALLFLGAGAAIHAVHSNNIHDMGGLLKRNRLASALFIIGALALAGVPGFAGFFSKDLILEELAAKGAGIPLGMLVLAAFLTALYMSRVVFIAFLGQPAKADGHLETTPASMNLPMLLLGVLSVAAGFFGVDFAQLVGGHYAFHMAPVGIIATSAGLLAILIGGLQWGAGRSLLPAMTGPRDFIRSGPVDRIWDRMWREALLPFAKAIGWLDRYVVDGLINLIAWIAVRLAEALRLLQTGKVQDYVYAVVVGVILFVAFGAISG
jgi:NADH-quinone oxidoreductase subunit L